MSLLQSWTTNVNVDNGWSVVAVTHHLDSYVPLFHITFRGPSNSRVTGRFDYDKRMFLDVLPITVDTSDIRNLITSLLRQ